jgi:hypothetical protein
MLFMQLKCWVSCGQCVGLVIVVCLHFQHNMAAQEILSTKAKFVGSLDKTESIKTSLYLYINISAMFPLSIIILLLIDAP